MILTSQIFSHKFLNFLKLVHQRFNGRFLFYALVFTPILGVTPAAPVLHIDDAWCYVFVKNTADQLM